MKASTAELESAAADVPPVGTNADELYSWLQGLEPLRFPTLTGLDPTELVTSFFWWDLIATSEFWTGGGDGTLTDAVAGVLTGLWSVGTRAVVVVRGTNTGVRFTVGVTGHLGGRFDTFVGSQLPASTWRRLDMTAGAGPAPGDARSVLVAVTAPPAAVIAGRPAPRRSPVDIPLIEQFAATSHTGWAFVTYLHPLPLPFIEKRATALLDLAAAVGGATQVQRAAGPVAQITTRDTAAEHLAALVDAELATTEAALRIGGFLVASWIAAADEETSAALAGIVSGLGVPAGGPEAAEGQRPRSIPLRSWHIDGTAALPATFLHPADIAVLIQPPLHDVAGLPCAPHARFDLDVDDPGGRPHVIAGVTPTGHRWALTLSSVVKHVGVFGIPGSGKTSFCFALLRQLAGVGVVPLVIEPVKCEYRVAPLRGLRVWSVGAPEDEGWRFNPFAVPRGVAVESHIDLLIAAFETMDLVSPLGAVLRDAMRDAYETFGWDLASSTNPRVGSDAPLYPTFTRVVDQCLMVIDRRDYSERVKSDLRGAIDMRLRSFARGALGRDLDTDRGVDVAALLASPLVINLDAVGDNGQKAFVMGVLLASITEHLRRSPSIDLRHVVVIEEAHRLLGAAGPGAGNGSDGPADARTRTTETFANLLAEIRGLGAGVVLVDQRPSALDPACIALTATKVALRTVAGEDRDTLAASMNLDEPQKMALAALKPHAAIVFSEGMDRPVRADLVHDFGAEAPQPNPATPVHRVALTSPMRALMNRLLRVTHTEATTAVTALEQQVRRLMGDRATRADVRMTVAALIGDAVEDAGRTRRWSLAQRDRAATATVTGKDGADHPRRLLLDGRLPFPACSAVCPTGGCLVGDVAAPAARTLRADPAFDIERVISHPDRLRRRLHRIELDLIGPDASTGHPDSLGRLCRACVAAQTFDADADPVTVGNLIRDVLTEPPEAAGP